MSEKTVAQKARVKPGTTIALINQIPTVIESLGLPDDVRFVDPSEAQIVILLVRARAELDALMPVTVSGLPAGAVLWVIYRKGSKTAGLDMSRDTIWSIAESRAMRPLGLIGIDGDWSVFRLRPPTK